MNLYARKAGVSYKLDGLEHVLTPETIAIKAESIYEQAKAATTKWLLISK